MKDTLIDFAPVFFSFLCQKPSKLFISLGIRLLNQM